MTQCLYDYMYALNSGSEHLDRQKVIQSLSDITAINVNGS